MFFVFILLNIVSISVPKEFSNHIAILEIISLFFVVPPFLVLTREYTKKLKGNLSHFERFVDESVLVSRTDKFGRITYVNKKFEDVSGYTLKEVMGKNHNIVNSGQHSKDFWVEMYRKTIVEKGIWNGVITNKNKNGELYWVDSYIIADFDENDKLNGFRSIRYDVTEIVKQNIEIETKNTYLEHAAKILRHDMHSGINTYIPRGVSSLERRLSPEQMEELKITAPFKMIKEGLAHTQKVYKGVYEFTNLVKKDACLNVTMCNLKVILDSYLSSTSYKSQVIIHELVDIEVNESLFCTAIDNLIRNGLKYNDSNTKIVELQMEDDLLTIQDNGRGMTQEEFLHLSKPYTRKEGQQESGTGLGLNICVAILKEHGFSISAEKNEIGTKMKIKLK
jgi:two-component system, sensor histidine kinase